MWDLFGKAAWNNLKDSPEQIFCPQESGGDRHSRFALKVFTWEVSFFFCYCFWHCMFFLTFTRENETIDTRIILKLKGDSSNGSLRECTAHCRDMGSVPVHPFVKVAMTGLVSQTSTSDVCSIISVRNKQHHTALWILISRKTVDEHGHGW